MTDVWLIAAAFSAMTGVDIRPSTYVPQSPDDVPISTLSMNDLFRSTFVMTPMEMVFTGGDMEVYVMMFTGYRYMVQVSALTTVAHVKITVCAQSGVPVSQQRLIYNGKDLKDHDTIESANIPHGGTIYLVITLKGGGGTWYMMDDSLLDPDFNYDFTRVNDARQIFTRGGYPYMRPCGWRRIALKVVGLPCYVDDKWLNQNDSEGWPVTYHGTGVEYLEKITKEGYKAGPRAAYGKGVYSSPSIEMVGHNYSKSFEYGERSYKVALQNRVNPDIEGGHLKIIPAAQTVVGADYWVSLKQDTANKVYDVRPYAILIRDGGPVRATSK